MLHKPVAWAKCGNRMSTPAVHASVLQCHVRVQARWLHVGLASMERDIEQQAQEVLTIDQVGACIDSRRRSSLDPRTVELRIEF